jgi:hypothetical protein
MTQAELFPATKRCRTCSHEKSVLEFSKLSGITEKRRGTCKECERGKLKRHTSHYDKCDCGKTKRSSAKRCESCHINRNAEEVLLKNGKQCSRCMRVLDVSKFGRRQERGITRVRARCKSCECEYASIRRQSMTVEQRREIRRANHIREKSKPWMARRISSIKRFCRKRGWNLAVTEQVVEAFRKTKVCQICKKERQLVIDHCHETNVFRGLLCSPCNQAIGLMCDDASVMKSAAAYLKSSNRK